MSRITLQDNNMSAVVKMAGGNMGAVSPLIELLAYGGQIDPDGFCGGLGLILLLDTLEIYDTDIYVLYSDICDRDIVKMATAIRAFQLGFISKEKLKDAAGRQDRSGKGMIPIDELFTKVQATLPHFAR